ncbi:MAG: insulinase family protein [Polyangiaceae bacterium]
MRAGRAARLFSRVGLLLTALVLVACQAAREPLPPPDLPLVPTPVEPFRLRPPAVPDTAPLELPPIHRSQLDNGLTLLVTERPDSEIVTLCYVSRDAGVDVSPMTAGHLRLATELLTQDGPLEQLGVEVSHAPDASLLCLTVLPDEVEAAFDALGRALVAPQILPTRVAAVRARWLELVDANPDAQRLAHRWLLGDRSIALSGPEVKASLERFDLVAAQRQIAASYHPRASALAVVGRVAVPEVMRLARARLGAWAPGVATQGVARLAEPPPPSPAPVRAIRAPRTQATLAMAFAAPSRSSPDRAAFSAVEQILGGMFSSRLNLALREGQGHSYGAYARYSPFRQDGVLTVVTHVAPTKVPEAVDRLLREVDAMATTLPSPLELQQSQRTAREALRAGLERTPTLAAALCELFVDGEEPEIWLRWDAAIAALSPAAVRDLAARYLTRRSPLMVVAPPEAVAALRRARPDTAVDSWPVTNRER